MQLIKMLGNDATNSRSWRKKYFNELLRSNTNNNRTMRKIHFDETLSENKLKLSRSYRNSNLTFGNNTTLSRDWRNKYFDKIFERKEALSRSLRKSYFIILLDPRSNKITKMFSKAKVSVFVFI